MQPLSDNLSETLKRIKVAQHNTNTEPVTTQIKGVCSFA